MGATFSIYYILADSLLLARSLWAWGVGFILGPDEDPLEDDDAAQPARPRVLPPRRRSVAEALRQREVYRWREVSVQLTRATLEESFGVELDMAYSSSSSSSMRLATSGHIVDVSPQAEAAGVRLFDALAEVNGAASSITLIREQIEGRLEVTMTLLRPPDSMLLGLAVDLEAHDFIHWCNAVDAAAIGDVEQLFDGLARLTERSGMSEREIVATRNVTDVEVAALVARGQYPHAQVKAGRSLREVALRGGELHLMADLDSLLNVDSDADGDSGPDRSYPGSSDDDTTGGRRVEGSTGAAAPAAAAAVRVAPDSPSSFRSACSRGSADEEGDTGGTDDMPDAVANAVANGLRQRWRRLDTSADELPGSPLRPPRLSGSSSGGSRCSSRRGSVTPDAEVVDT